MRDSLSQLQQQTESRRVLLLEPAHGTAYFVHLTDAEVTKKGDETEQQQKTDYERHDGRR